MLTLKYLVEDSGLTVYELLEKYHVRIGSNDNFQLTRPVSLTGQVSTKKMTQVAIDKIKEFCKTVKRVGDAYDGKTFCLARSLELSNDDTLYAVLRQIVSNGGKYTAKLFKGNVYVSGTNPTEQDVMREKRVAELAEQSLIVTVTIEQVLQGQL